MGMNSTHAAWIAYTTASTTSASRHEPPNTYTTAMRPGAIASPRLASSAARVSVRSRASGYASISADVAVPPLTPAAMPHTPSASPSAHDVAA